MRKRIDDYLKSLIEQKAYEQIYLEFGAKAYWKYATLSYQLEDIKKLLKEERFYALYEKYGDVIYNLLLPYMKKRDIKYELGYNPKEKTHQTYEEKIKVAVLTVILSTLVLNTSFDSLLIMGLNLTNDDSIEDEKFLEIKKEYDSSIEEYAKYINSLGLNDLETIVKVMSDMWANIYGYNSLIDDEWDNVNYGRLAVYTYGYGVCRHLADDFTARMNAINPKYNAFNMTVYMQNNYELNAIERFWFPTDLPDTEEESSLVMEFMKSKIGNHMVTCLTILDTNIHFVVDVTNPSIGVLKNGVVTMLTEKDVDTLIPMHDSNIGYKWKNKDELGRYLMYYLQSFFVSSDMKELNKKYGTLAQNEALEKVSKYDTSNYEIDPVNVDNKDPDKGKSPLYYNGYTILYNGDTMRLISLSSDVSPLEEVSYHEINSFLKRYPEITHIEVEYFDNTIDFSRIDFSNLESIDSLSILSTNFNSTDVVLEINGSIKELSVTLNTSRTECLNRVVLRTENTSNIAITLQSDADEVVVNPNENADCISINSNYKPNYSVTNHTGLLKLNYCIDGVVETEEITYEKRLQKIK